MLPKNATIIDETTMVHEGEKRAMHAATYPEKGWFVRDVTVAMGDKGFALEGAKIFNKALNEIRPERDFEKVKNRIESILEEIINTTILRSDYLPGGKSCFTFHHVPIRDIVANAINVSPESNSIISLYESPDAALDDNIAVDAKSAILDHMTGSMAAGGWKGVRWESPDAPEMSAQGMRI